MDTTGLILVAFGLILAVAGVLFLIGKGYVFVGGYKNMSAEDRSYFTTGWIRQLVGILLLVGGVATLICGVWSEELIDYFIWIMIVWFVVCGISLYLVSKKTQTEENRFRNRFSLN